MSEHKAVTVEGYTGVRNIEGYEKGYICSLLIVDHKLRGDDIPVRVTVEKVEEKDV